MVSEMRKKYLGTIRNFWKFIGTNQAFFNSKGLLRTIVKLLNPTLGVTVFCYGIIIKLIRVTKLQSDRELI